MMKYDLSWPQDFDEYAWEVEAKGWFSDLTVRSNGRAIKPVFYDPKRLEQDIAEEVAVQGFFAQCGLIVLERVTRANMAMAIEKMASAGKLEALFVGK